MKNRFDWLVVGGQLRCQMNRNGLFKSAKALGGKVGSFLVDSYLFCETKKIKI
jgi:hypothetical protein